MLAIDLSDKLALVTGATGELGRVMVRTLAQAGADVVIHYHRNAAKADELKTELADMGRRAIAVQADVTDPAGVDAMRDTVLAECGAFPGILVNNAVIQFGWKSVLEQDDADFESQFRSAVLHNLYMTKAFVPAMIENHWGRVIGINTECLMQCWPSQAAYASGKAGMDRLLRVLAKEVGEHGITVNQVAPGWTISENRPDEGTPQFYLAGVPLKRRGTDQEIANAVAFLASDLASYISGVYLPVCGGNVMPGV